MVNKLVKVFLDFDDTAYNHLSNNALLKINSDKLE